MRRVIEKIDNYNDIPNDICKVIIIFQSKVGPALLKLTIVILLLHSMTCGWIYVACRGIYLYTFPLQSIIMSDD